MSAVVEQRIHTVHSEDILLHLGALQQLFDGGSVFNAVEGLVQAVLLDGCLER